MVSTELLTFYLQEWDYRQIYFLIYTFLCSLIFFKECVLFLKVWGKKGYFYFWGGKKDRKSAILNYNQEYRNLKFSENTLQKNIGVTFPICYHISDQLRLGGMLKMTLTHSFHHSSTLCSIPLRLMTKSFVLFSKGTISRALARSLERCCFVGPVLTSPWLWLAFVLWRSVSMNS